jgi:hypothetical protein
MGTRNVQDLISWEAASSKRWRFLALGVTSECAPNEAPDRSSAIWKGRRRGKHHYMMLQHGAQPQDLFVASFLDAEEDFRLASFLVGQSPGAYAKQYWGGAWGGSV